MSHSPAAKPNPALERFAILIGTWVTSGEHGLLPGIRLHGRAEYRWLEEGAFLIKHAEIDDPRFPAAIAVFGSDDSTGELFMLTFDERGVSRKYDLEVEDNVVSCWRNAPGFFQRYTWSFLDDGMTIVEKGELSKDGESWEKDLELIYTREK